MSKRPATQRRTDPVVRLKRYFNRLYAECDDDEERGRLVSAAFDVATERLLEQLKNEMPDIDALLEPLNSEMLDIEAPPGGPIDLEGLDADQ